MKKIFTHFITFLFGVEVGGFTLWYMAIKVLSEPYNRKRNRGCYTSYSHYYDEKWKVKIQR